MADALGIALDSDPDALISEEAERNYAHKPSMLQDALAHRPTEIGALNGGIVQAGRRRRRARPRCTRRSPRSSTGLEAGWAL